MASAPALVVVEYSFAHVTVTIQGMKVHGVVYMSICYRLCLIMQNSAVLRHYMKFTSLGFDIHCNDAWNSNKMDIFQLKISN